jgi:hypothetical protein
MTAIAYDPVIQAPSCWTGAWWLRHCLGFQVDTPLGRLGYVDEVQFDADGDPAALVVGGQGRCVVPIAQVVAVDVEREHVRIR